MKIDGYTPPDPKFALETGVEFKYPTDYGDFWILAKSSGRENVDFQKAAEALEHRRSIQAKTGYKPGVEARAAETVDIWFDHVIIDWSTTVKSGGKKIEPTKENFIEIMTDDLFINVFLALTTDCASAANFVAEVEEDTKKN